MQNKATLTIEDRVVTAAGESIGSAETIISIRALVACCFQMGQGVMTVSLGQLSKTIKTGKNGKTATDGNQKLVPVQDLFQSIGTVSLLLFPFISAGMFSDMSTLHNSDIKVITVKHVQMCKLFSFSSFLKFYLGAEKIKQLH